MTSSDRVIPFVNAHTHVQTAGSALNRNEPPPALLSLCSFTPGDEIPEQIRFFSAGYHPMDAEKFSEEALFHLLDDPRCIAAGECGLDPFVSADMEKQQEVFLRQAILAQEAGKGLVIHCVRRFPELLSLRKKIDPKQKKVWLIHGFRAREAIGKELLKAECILSLSPTYLRRLEQFPSWLPVDRFLLETDTESSHELPFLYEKAGGLLQMDQKTLRERLYKTFCSFASL